MREAQKIVISGGGAFGTALAIVLSNDNHYDVTLLMRNAENAKQTEKTRCNQMRLPGVMLPDGLKITARLSDIRNADIILSVVPTNAQIAFAKQAKPYLASKSVFVLCSKGFDKKTGDLISTRLNTILPFHPIAVLSGPGFAYDIAKGLPTAMTIAMLPIEQAENLSNTLSRKNFRLYASDDLVGVQIGGALKNVFAIAAGIVMGADLGESARASIIARGLAELSRYIRFMGGKTETGSGLSGLGDLVLTASSEQSRNYQYGIALGKGFKAEDLKGCDKPLVEGANTALAAAQIARDDNIALPITQSIAAIIKGQLDVQSAIKQLLTRPLRSEYEYNRTELMKPD